MPTFERVLDSTVAVSGDVLNVGGSLWTGEYSWRNDESTCATDDCS